VLPDSDDETLATGNSPDAVSFMEWSNSLARFMAKQDGEVSPEEFQSAAKRLPGRVH
jgi:hypothetical protein